MSIRRFIKIFGLFVCFFIILWQHSNVAVYAQQASSILYEKDGRLTYISDQEGNRIPDFSHAGYRGGGVSLPYYPVKISISPGPGDDTQRIQGAINYVEDLPKDQDGIRGAVELKPGIFEISGNLQIRKSGVVLRGSGSGSDPGNATILQVSKSVRGTVVQIGNDADWLHDFKSPTTVITSEFVPVGSRNFEVEDISFLDVGDNIILRHRSSQEWLDAINGGDTASDPSWQEGYIEIYYNRVITGIQDSTISIDAPVYNHLDRNLSTTQIFKPTRKNLVRESGIEYLRIIIRTDGETSDNHADNGVTFDGVENGWARHVNVFHFSLSGFLIRNSKNITIVNSKALEPHSPLTGEKRYNFDVQLFSNNILFENVTSSNGRRSFVSNGTSVASGIVFLDSRSIGALNSSEGHQKWSQALLYDNITFEDPQTYFVLGLYNRGDIGTSHGWGAVHSVAWNVDAGGQNIYIQKPPNAQNYGIGNKGFVSGDGLFDHPAGYIEGTNSNPVPQSLYRAQLEERLKYGVPPDTPARLEVSNNIKNQLDLKWLHSSVKETGFIIERSNDGGNTFQQIDVTQDSDSSYTDKTVAEYHYHYRVRAEDSNGLSAYSNIASAEPSFTSEHISDFELIYPKDQAEYSIETDPDSLLVFEWEQADTPLEIDYTWLLEKEDGEFTKPIAQISTDENNSISVSIRDIINYLDDASISFESDLALKWTATARSKTVEKQAKNVFFLTFVKRHDSDILDEPGPNSDGDEDKETELSQNFPNPFNPITTIRFYLSEESNVSLEVYDLTGTRVAVIENGQKERGYHIVNFNGSNLSSGIYMYRLKTNNRELTRKMILIK